MYNIVFADLIETFVLPNAAYLLTLDSDFYPKSVLHHNDVSCLKGSLLF